jgi:hypothetical protein
MSAQLCECGHPQHAGCCWARVRPNKFCPCECRAAQSLEADLDKDLDDGALGSQNPARGEWLTEPMP